MANGVTAFDTYEFVKRLTAAGLPVEAAETFAKEQSRLIETVASKEDLKDYKSDMKEDFKHLEDLLSAKMELLKKDIIIRITAVVMGTGGLMLAAIKLLF